MSDLPLSAQIEAVLFFKGGNCSIKELEKAVGSTSDAVEEALGELKASLEGRGLVLLREGNTVALGTAPGAHALIEALRHEELEGPLGKAGLETLAIVMYRGPLSRADIEYIRGVNVSSALRSLMIRGLVERVDHPTDKRSFHYRVTTEVPAYLGLGSVKELPEYESIIAEVDAVMQEKAVADAKAEENND